MNDELVGLQEKVALACFVALSWHSVEGYLKYN